jgi:beta-galactosidase
MAELGLRYVRVAEFAWSRLEPSEGKYNFDWLDQAIETLAAAGLEVIMCTPTATPPKWLIDKWPEILPRHPDTGRTRGFGSRRHYDFSSDIYLREALRISEAVAKRYGRHRSVVGWQTDNELCCHDTTLSGSTAARQAFQGWCEQRYVTVDALNDAWGNVFWSMEYAAFSEIELPIGAVTETSPAHQLAYRRFSSDKVINFHQRMVDVIRRHAPDAFVTHNFIPMADTSVDDYALAEPLDFASFDNYPLGRTDLLFADAPHGEFRRYMRTGHPDLSSYFFDQTRRLVNASFWVMEQQPGPVNWASSNPRPADGMIRLWTLEAFAHGAECVCFFRWRQAAFAQEQMHAGLLRPDNSKARAWQEAERAIADIGQLDLSQQADQTAPVAIVTSVEGQWVSDIERQGEAYRFDDVQFDYYCALRALGVDVDFVSQDSDLAPYAIVVVPSLPIPRTSFLRRCAECDATLVFGPRSGAKTGEFGIPSGLPPGHLQDLLPIRVLSVETLRADCSEPLTWNGETYASRAWREEIDAGAAEVMACYADGSAAVVRHDRSIYLATLTERRFLQDFLQHLCNTSGVATFELADGVRLQRRGDLTFAFNYSEQPASLPLPDHARIVIGSREIEARGVTVWQSEEGRH